MPVQSVLSPTVQRQEKGTGTDPEPPPTWERKPLQVIVVSARGLRNADWGPFNGKSDPYCICEIKNKPLSKTVTQVIDNNLNPVWNYEITFADYDFGDSLTFTVWDQDIGKRDDFLGFATLESEQFHPGGFDGELQLQNAGKGISAFIKARVDAATAKQPEARKTARIQEPPIELFVESPLAKRTSQLERSSAASGAGSLKTAWSASTCPGGTTRPRKRLPSSGNTNMPGDYIWLEDALKTLSSGEAGGLGCCDTSTGKAQTPLFFVLGACPSSFAGMQAVVFCADSESKVDFWWVKPKKADSSQIEIQTLSRNEKGAFKNDPGRSKSFYQPLADLFQEGALVHGWRFGLTKVTVSDGGKETIRAFIQREAAADRAAAEAAEEYAPYYLHVMWQEDWTSNPFARSKYIRGKLVYERKGTAGSFYSRQYEFRDGLAIISDVEEGPASAALPTEDVKNLYELKEPK